MGRPLRRRRSLAATAPPRRRRHPKSPLRPRRRRRRRRAITERRYEKFPDDGSDKPTISQFVTFRKEKKKKSERQSETSAFEDEEDVVGQPTNGRRREAREEGRENFLHRVPPCRQSLSCSNLLCQCRSWFAKVCGRTDKKKRGRGITKLHFSHSRCRNTDDVRSIEFDRSAPPISTPPPKTLLHAQPCGHPAPTRFPRKGEREKIPAEDTMIFLLAVPPVASFYGRKKGEDGLGEVPKSRLFVVITPALLTSKNS